MVEMQKMIAEKKNKWGDKVRFVAISIDQDLAKWRKFIEEKKLTEFDHYNCRYKECRAMHYFGVRKVPLAFIIDK